MKQMKGEPKNGEKGKARVERRRVAMRLWRISTEGRKMSAKRLDNDLDNFFAKRG